MNEAWCIGLCNFRESVCDDGATSCASTPPTIQVGVPTATIGVIQKKIICWGCMVS
jgi:hypothetical protein